MPSKTPSKTPSDQAKRSQALNLNASFIVQAPAGSGKTGLLVRRLLALLACVQQPEEILAITFTRKATQEMRGRVLESLRKVAEGAAFEDHEQDLAQLAQAAATQDAKQGWNLTQHAGRLRIMTIDSLCMDLVRRMPWSTRFGAMPRVEQKPELLYLQAALNCLSKIETPSSASGAAIATLLTELEGNLVTLQKRLAQMLFTRDRWLPLILAPADDNDVSQQIIAAWQQLALSELEEAETCLGQAMVSELLQIAAHCAQNLPAKYHESAFGIAILSQPDEPLSQSEKQQLDWAKITALLLTDKSDLRKGAIDIRLGFVKELKAPEQQRLKDILASLEDDDSALQALQRIRQLPSADFDAKQSRLLSALLAVLPDLAAELYVLMSKGGVADYTQITTQAIAALGGLEQPSDLALMLDTALNHILMDEFQDTSLHQLKLIERLCVGWQNGDGRSLFLVGDPMQSIYRFRDADVRVFLAVRDRGINDIRLKELQLDTNFRSAAALVNWVNQTLPDVLSAKDRPELGAVAFSPSQAFKHDTAGAVHCQLVVSEKATDEGRVIAAKVRALAAQLADKQDLAVLARTRRHLKSIAAALRESDTNFESIELEVLGDQACIQDLFALTRLFIHPQDVVAWLSLLRAPWCGVTLPDITLLRAHNRNQESLWDNAGVLDMLSTEGAMRYRRCEAILRPRLGVFGADLESQVRSAWLALSGPACVQEHELSYCDAYFDLLRAMAKQGQGNTTQSIDMQSLDQSLAQTHISSPQAKIKLLTLHKAKGLEFDIVVLAGLCGKQQSHPQTSKLLEWDATSASQAALIAPANYPGQSDCRHSAWIRAREKQREQLEAGRLLYVGVTRAKSALYLFGHLKNAETNKPESSSLMALLWPQLSAEFRQHVIQVSAPDESDVRPDSGPDSGPEAKLPNGLRRLAPSLPALNLPAAISLEPHQPSSDPLPYEWAQEQARIVGIVVHKVLQIMAWQSPLEWDTPTLADIARQQLLQMGLALDECDEALALSTQYLQNMVEDEQAHWLYQATHTQRHIEWPLSGVVNGQIVHRVIDRSFIDVDGNRWIVDFKTSPHHGTDVEAFLAEQQRRYQQQLETYAILVSGLEAAVPIRLGLYFPALKAWREWAYVP